MVGFVPVTPDSEPGLRSASCAWAVTVQSTVTANAAEAITRRSLEARASGMGRVWADLRENPSEIVARKWPEI
jgi:hypothetical protein